MYNFKKHPSFFLFTPKFYYIQYLTVYFLYLNNVGYQVFVCFVSSITTRKSLFLSSLPLLPAMLSAGNKGPRVW